jgi:phage terminase large subunit-like protein
VASCPSVGLDPFGVGAIVDALAEVGIAGNDWVVGNHTGLKLTGAIKTADRKLADVRHGGCCLIVWAVGQCEGRTQGQCHSHY